jgi:hypothetical protein
MGGRWWEGGIWLIYGVEENTGPRFCSYKPHRDMQLCDQKGRGCIAVRTHQPPTEPPTGESNIRCNLPSCRQLPHNPTAHCRTHLYHEMHGYTQPAHAAEGRAHMPPSFCLSPEASPFDHAPITQLPPCTNAAAPKPIPPQHMSPDTAHWTSSTRVSRGSRREMVSWLSTISSIAARSYSPRSARLENITCWAVHFLRLHHSIKFASQLHLETCRNKPEI